MKRLLRFIPLAIGISSAIIYIFNIISFRAINNTVAMAQILSSLKVYLYVSVAGFIVYGLIKIFSFIYYKKHPEKVLYEPVIEEVENNKETEGIKEEETPVITKIENNEYVPNYDYVPVYKKEDNVISEEESYEPFEKINISEEKEDVKVSIFANYCNKCGEKVDNYDVFCKNCGNNLKEDKKHLNMFMKNLINVIEIVILILIIYFSLNMLFTFKEKQDPNFKSPFKVVMTK